MTETKELGVKKPSENVTLVEKIKEDFRSLKSQFRRASRSRRDFSDVIFKFGLGVVSLIVILPFFLVLYQVVSNGAEIIFSSEPGRGIEFFTTNPGPGQALGIRNSIVGTLWLVIVAGSIGIPLSVFGAIFITEYLAPGTLRNIIEFAADILAGIPSIVFGAFGMAFIVDFLHIGRGLFTGGATLAFMMIPTVLRTTQEALRAVPVSLREASLALGATKWSTTWNVTIRAAFPGIITGILLAIGRIMGETAPLILTSGYSLFEPKGLFGPESWVASMPYTIYLYIINPNAVLQAKAYGTALALMMIVLAIDVIANVLSRKLTRRVV
ncbi:MAG: phosphate ABC transporter permease PstA [Candidatus Lokiarchaeota archaeon]|nr:phosphate ABC transporter permease PstA [Candidatus Lokiarchaeota archaeon]